MLSPTLKKVASSSVDAFIEFSPKKGLWRERGIRRRFGSGLERLCRNDLRCRPELGLDLGERGVESFELRAFRRRREPTAERCHMCPQPVQQQEQSSASSGEHLAP